MTTPERAATPEQRRERVLPDAPRIAHVAGPAEDEACDHCGERRLAWRKCKLICANCAHINKSCADL